MWLVTSIQHMEKRIELAIVTKNHIKLEVILITLCVHDGHCINLCLK
jgi:hypothetical protein